MKCFISSVVVLVVTAHVGKVQGGAGWEYDGELGPEEWHKSFERCGGRMQSPVNVETNLVVFNRNLRSFDLQQYSVTEGINMTLENVDGHTVEVVYEGKEISISGGSLPDVYVLDQFHFHWGADNSRGSEHTVDSKAAPMEMHIVHHMSKFNRSEASINPYGLAVLGFFFQIGGHNAAFEALLSNFRDVIHKGAKKSISPFALSGLLDSGNGSTSYYYRYFGSLTTPPCYETVIWTLFKKRITISQEQLDTFRTLRNQREGDPTETPIGNDFRPPQPLHERLVTSNDPEQLSEATTNLIKTLKEDLRLLQEACAAKGSSGSSPAGVTRLASWAVISGVIVAFVLGFC